MKIAFSVEGLSDQIAVPIFVRRILKREIEPVFRTRRIGGVRTVLRTLTGFAWEFWGTDAYGLVVTIDNDERLPVHDNTHGSHNIVSNCNYCDLLSRLPILPDRAPLPPFKVGVGVAVQALESWLLADGKMPGPTESMDRKKMKLELYNTTHPTREHFETICKPKAEKIDLDFLRKACPSFAFFENSVKTLAN